MNIASLGTYRDRSTARFVNAFQLQDAPAYGEKSLTEYATTSPTLQGGTHGCGESGIWPRQDFLMRFEKVPDKAK